MAGRDQPSPLPMFYLSSSLLRRGPAMSRNMQAQAETKNASDVYPPGFFQRTEGEDAGLWHTEIGKDGEPVETKIGPNLFVLGQTRDDNGKSWGLLLAWQDPDGDGHTWAMPKSMLEGDPAEYRKRLADEGWSPAPNPRARAKLAEFLATARPETRVRCVPRTGWHGSAYVFPDETIDDEANHA